MRTAKRGLRRLPALLMAALVILTLLPAAALAAESATTMRLVGTSGTVTVANASGQKKSIFSNMQLYNGWTVETGQASYATLSLDGAKAVKLDAVTRVELRQNTYTKKLEIYVSKGRIFFDVSEKLGDDETMNIRTSTMVCGIRGTIGESGYDEDNNSYLALAEGSSDQLAGGAVQTVNAGRRGIVTPGDGYWYYPQLVGFTDDPMDPYGLAGFSLVEVVGNSGRVGRILRGTNGKLDFSATNWDEVSARLAADQQRQLLAQQGTAAVNGGGIATWQSEVGYVPSETTEFSVTFIDALNQTSRSQIVAPGGLADRPEDPTFPGYEFVGWFDSADSAVPYDFDTPVKTDLILIARWTPITCYKINIGSDLENGAVTADRDEAAAGETVTLTVTPAEGYDVLRVYYCYDGQETTKDVAAEDGVYSFAMPASEVWVYADFTAAICDVSFDADGGAPEPDVQRVPYGGTVTRPSTDPEKDGYDFAGWYKGDVLYDFEAPVMESFSLTAHWTAKEPEPEQYAVNIVEELDGGAVTADRESAAEGETVTLTVTPEDGWRIAEVGYESESADAPSEIIEPADGVYSFAMPASDVWVYAVFEQMFEIDFSGLAYGEVTQVKIGETVYTGEFIPSPLLVAPEDDVELTYVSEAIPGGVEFHGLGDDGDELPYNLIALYTIGVDGTEGELARSAAVHTVDGEEDAICYEMTSVYGFSMPAEDLALEELRLCQFRVDATGGLGAATAINGEPYEFAVDEDVSGQWLEVPYYFALPGETVTLEFRSTMSYGGPEKDVYTLESLTISVPEAETPLSLMNCVWSEGESEEGKYRACAGEFTLEAQTDGVIEIDAMMAGARRIRLPVQEGGRVTVERLADLEPAAPEEGVEQIVFATSGQNIFLTAEPEEGFRLGSGPYYYKDYDYSGDGEFEEAVDLGDLCFQMPEYDGVVQAYFYSRKAISLSAGANGSVTELAVDGEEATEAYPGQTVTFKAVPDAGYEIDYVSLSYENGAAFNEYLTPDGDGVCSFEMPAADAVTVSVSFKKTAYTVTAALTDSGRGTVSFAVKEDGEYTPRDAGDPFYVGELVQVTLSCSRDDNDWDDYSPADVAVTSGTDTLEWAGTPKRFSTVADETIIDHTDVYEFVMPAGDVTLSGGFVPCWEVQINYIAMVQAEKGSWRVVQADDIEIGEDDRYTAFVTAGQTVTVEVSPAEGWEATADEVAVRLVYFDGEDWDSVPLTPVTQEDDTHFSFTLPDGDETEDLSYLELSVDFRRAGTNITLSPALRASIAEANDYNEVEVAVSYAKVVDDEPTALEYGHAEEGDTVQVIFSIHQGDESFCTEGIEISGAGILSAERVPGENYNTWLDVYTFEMPAGSVVIDGSVPQAYEVAGTAKTNENHGAVTIAAAGGLTLPEGTTLTFAAPGQTVTVAAGETEEGYKLLKARYTADPGAAQVEWTEIGKDAKGAFSFEMPGETAVTVAGVFDLQNRFLIRTDFDDDDARLDIFDVLENVYVDGDVVQAGRAYNLRFYVEGDRNFTVGAGGVRATRADGAEVSDLGFDSAEYGEGGYYCAYVMVMPDSDVTVSATFAELRSFTITVTGGDYEAVHCDAGYIFDSGSDPAYTYLAVPGETVTLRVWGEEGDSTPQVTVNGESATPVSSEEDGDGGKIWRYTFLMPDLTSDETAAVTVQFG